MLKLLWKDLLVVVYNLSVEILNLVEKLPCGDVERSGKTP
jgi:hypothetical protein